MELTLDKYSKEALRLLDQLILRNYNEAEKLSQTNEKKEEADLFCEEKISNLHTFNHRLYYIKVELLDMMKNNKGGN